VVTARQAMAHMHVPLAHDPKWDNTSPRSDRQVYGDTLREGACRARAIWVINMDAERIHSFGLQHQVSHGCVIIRGYH
jgi:hypothetical protein